MRRIEGKKTTTHIVFRKRIQEESREDSEVPLAKKVKGEFLLLSHHLLKTIIHRSCHGCCCSSNNNKCVFSFLFFSFSIKTQTQLKIFSLSFFFLNFTATSPAVVAPSPPTGEFVVVFFPSILLIFPSSFFQLIHCSQMMNKILMWSGCARCSLRKSSKKSIIEDVVKKLSVQLITTVGDLKKQSKEDLRAYGIPGVIVSEAMHYLENNLTKRFVGTNCVIVIVRNPSCIHTSSSTTHSNETLPPKKNQIKDGMISESVALKQAVESLRCSIKSSWVGCKPESMSAAMEFENIYIYACVWTCVFHLLNLQQHVSHLSHGKNLIVKE